jgi:tellurite resistance protein TerC
MFSNAVDGIRIIGKVLRMEHASIGSPILWVSFLAFVVVMLGLDLGVFHRKAHVVGAKEALRWTLFWIALALLFNLGIWQYFGTRPAVEFLTGYLVEKSLSVDNIFVFVVLFSTLGIPAIYQHRVLFWGILTALVLRAVMILFGTAMLARFHWLFYVFGAFLVITGIRLFIHRNDEESSGNNRLLTWLRRFIPSTNRLESARFFTVENGKRVATPLFVALVLIELSDVMFAVDSIPAILAITQDTFIVFTSNVFAILGLRSLFFFVANLVDQFHYLKLGLSAILVFVGLKMIIAAQYELSPVISLAVISTILVVSIISSLWRAKRKEALTVTGKPRA